MGTEIYILFFLISFLVIFLLDYNLLLKQKLPENLIKRSSKKKKVKNTEVMEVDYLSGKFKIKKESLKKKWIFLWIAFLNSLIISIVSSVISFIPVDKIFGFSENLEIGIKLMIGFVLLFGFIYSVYEIFGRYLVKKGIK